MAVENLPESTFELPKIVVPPCPFILLLLAPMATATAVLVFVVFALLLYPNITPVDL